MKIALTLFLGLLFAVVIVGVYVCGVAVGRRASFRAHLRDMGLTRDSAKLYRSAVKILYRLAQTVDLDGAMAGDCLSDETRQQVTNWVTTHRKEINKV